MMAISISAATRVDVVGSTTALVDNRLRFGQVLDCRRLADVVAGHGIVSIRILGESVVPGRGRDHSLCSPRGGAVTVGGRAVISPARVLVPCIGRTGLCFCGEAVLQSPNAVVAVSAGGLVVRHVRCLLSCFWTVESCS